MAPPNHHSSIGHSFSNTETSHECFDFAVINHLPIFVTVSFFIFAVKTVPSIDSKNSAVGRKRLPKATTVMKGFTRYEKPPAYSHISRGIIIC